jgi:galactitol-specific phosphotransferase system IIC component
MLGFGIAIAIAMTVIAAITYIESEDALRAAVKLGIAVVWAAVALVCQRLRARFDAAVAAGSIPMANHPAT